MSRGYTGIAGPLTDLLKGRDGDKKAPVVGAEKEERALKTARASAPSVATPDPKEKYHVHGCLCVRHRSERTSGT